MQLLPRFLFMSSRGALVAALLLAGPAGAADAEDCASNKPAVSIAACTRIITQARDPKKNRGGFCQSRQGPPATERIRPRDR